MRKYIQQKNLKDVFDLSMDYFVDRKGTEFFEGIHFFIPPTSSKTNKAVLWDLEALDNWIKGNVTDPEVENLLERR